MSFELINNLLVLSEKNMNEGDYSQVAMLLKEKYKIIDDVDYETLLIVPPIEISTHDGNDEGVYDEGVSLFTIKAFKYKKSMKNELRNSSRYLDGEFLFQVGEEEDYIKLKSFHRRIKNIIENQLLIYLSIKNSFYGKVKQFYILDYVLLYSKVDSLDDDYEECDRYNLFNSYVYDKFINICDNTIQETILLLFSKM